MKISIRSLLFLFAIAFIVPLTVTQAFAANAFGAGVYTNICGSSYAADGNGCGNGCNVSSGKCSVSGSYVVKFECSGKQTQCTSNESGFSSSQSLGALCGKTQQIDVFSKTCRSSAGQWVCGDGDLKDYMVWYSGDCGESSPTPTPAQTPTPPPTSTPTPAVYEDAQPIASKQETGTSTVLTFVALGVGILGLVFLKLKQKFMK
jgi:hypothetical protein